MSGSLGAGMIGQGWQGSSGPAGKMTVLQPQIVKEIKSQLAEWSASSPSGISAEDLQLLDSVARNLEQVSDHIGAQKREDDDYHIPEEKHGHAMDAYGGQES